MVIKKALVLLLVMLSCYSFSYATNLSSKEAVNYYNEAVKFQQARNFPEADIALQKAVLLDATNNPKLRAAAMNNKGILSVLAGDLKEAEVIFNEAIKIDPGYRPAQINLGIVYEKTRSRLEVLEYWVKVYNLDKLKPKDFAIEEGMEEEGKKKEKK